MTEPTKPENTKPPEAPPNPSENPPEKPPEPKTKQAGEKQTGPKRNKDGLIPGQRVSPKELAAVRLKKRKAAKK